MKSFLALLLAFSSAFADTPPPILLFNSPLSKTGHTISIPSASSSVNGYLTSNDWTTFNGKQASGSYVLTSRNVNTTSPITGGGALTSDLTIAIPVATSGANGYLSSTDWTTFNGKQSTGVSLLLTGGTMSGNIAMGGNSITGAAGLANSSGNVTITANNQIILAAGSLISANSNKIINLIDPSNPQDAATKNYVDNHGVSTGNLTDAGTDGITITGGTGAVVGSGTSLSQHVADTTHSGYLATADWNTFNGKQASGSYITALTGDVTASGPGSSAATLAATTNGTLTALTNANVTFSGNILTAADSTENIGAAATRFNNGYFGSLLTVGTSGNANGVSLFGTAGTTGGGMTMYASGAVSQTVQNYVGQIRATDSNGYNLYTWISGGTPSYSWYCNNNSVPCSVLNNTGLSLTGTISASNMSSANTASYIVQRDASGNFTAGTANLTQLGLNNTVGTSAAYLKTSGTTVPTLTLKAIGSQTANLFEILDSSAVTQMQFTGGGNFQFFNTVASPEARFDLRPSINVSSANAGANARYSMYVGDPTTHQAAGLGGGIAFGASQDNVGTATEFGYIFVTKDNSNSGDVGSTMHFLTHNNSTGEAQRSLELDTNGNANFYSNVSAVAYSTSLTSTATAAGTTTMTIASTGIQVWTGSTTQTIKLPTTSVVAGAVYKFINLSSGSLSIQSSGANAISTVTGSTRQECVALVATPTTAANWSCL